MDEQRLRRRQVGTYVAVSYDPDDESGGDLGWLYLRRQSDSVLFIANLPWPVWLPFENVIPPAKQETLQSHIAKLIPQHESVGDLFPTGNSRLAVRVQLASDAILTDLLANPSHHVYLPARDLMRRHANPAQTSAASPTCADALSALLDKHDEDRDVASVTTWANAAMKAYETRETLAAQKRLARERDAKTPDDDGFVTVTNGAPQIKARDLPATPSTGAISARGKPRAGRKRKTLSDVAKGVEKTGFYRWQRKNQNALAELRDKFRHDQKRVAAISGLDHRPTSGSAYDNDDRNS